MTLVTDFVGWLAHDAAAAHARLGCGADGRQPERPSARPAAAPPRARPLRGGAIGPEQAAAVVRMEAPRERRILQARRVIGTPVFDASGAKAGRITDLSIDKRTGRVVYALIGAAALCRGDGWLCGARRSGRPRGWPGPDGRGTAEPGRGRRGLAGAAGDLLQPLPHPAVRLTVSNVSARGRALRSFALRIMPSYWWDSRWPWIWVTVSMVTLTTMSSEVPPR